MNAPVALAHRLRRGGAVTLSRTPEGFDAFVVADLTRTLAREAESRAVALTVVARDSLRAQGFIDALAFAAPEIEALYLPALGLPALRSRLAQCGDFSAAHDGAGAAARRRAARRSGRACSSMTVNAIAATRPAEAFVAAAAFSAAPGNSVNMTNSRSGWRPTVFRARPSCAMSATMRMRGGILDLWAPGAPAPIRLDFFGDTLELIRSFDPETQRTRRPAPRARFGADERGAAHDRDDPPLSPRLRRRIRRAATGRFALRGGERGPARDPASSIGCRCSTTGSTRCSIMSRMRRSCSMRAPRKPPRRVRADRGLLFRAQDRQRGRSGNRRLPAAEAGRDSI